MSRSQRRGVVGDGAPLLGCHGGTGCTPKLSEIERGQEAISYPKSAEEAP